MAEIKISRNAVQVLRHLGLVDEPGQPRPRFDVRALLVNTIPFASPPRPPQRILEGFEGQPPPDRGVSRTWPDQMDYATQPDLFNPEA